MRRKPEFDYPTPAAQQTGERSHHDQIVGKQQPEGNDPPDFPEPELPAFRTFRVVYAAGLGVAAPPDATVVAHLPTLVNGALVFLDIVKKQVPATGEWIIYNQYRHAFAAGAWVEVKEVTLPAASLTVN